MAVERLHAQNYDEFIDFVDQVFSQDLIRVHFQDDMPLLFGPDEAHMQMQYAYRDESGRIRAAIGVIPYTYRVGNEEFSARTVTNVATHYRHTGKSADIAESQHGGAVGYYRDKVLSARELV